MPGITPSYRIGPSDFFTGDDLKADAATLNDQINRLNDQNWDKPSQGLFDAFQSFLSEWRRYYSNTFGGIFGGFFVALNNGNRDELIQMETRFQRFAVDYENESGISVPDIVAPSTGTKDGLGEHIKNQLQPILPSVNITYVIVGVVVAVVLYFWGQRYIAKKVMP